METLHTSAVMFTCRVQNGGHSNHEKVASYQSTMVLDLQHFVTHHAAVLASSKAARSEWACSR